MENLSNYANSILCGKIVELYIVNELIGIDNYCTFQGIMLTLSRDFEFI